MCSAPLIHPFVPRCYLCAKHPRLLSERFYRAAATTSSASMGRFKAKINKSEPKTSVGFVWTVNSFDDVKSNRDGERERGWEWGRGALSKRERKNNVMANNNTDYDDDFLFSLLKFICADFCCAVEQVHLHTSFCYLPRCNGLTRGRAPCALPGSSLCSLNATVAAVQRVTRKHL